MRSGFSSLSKALFESFYQVELIQPSDRQMSSLTKIPGCSERKTIESLTVACQHIDLRLSTNSADKKGVKYQTASLLALSHESSATCQGHLSKHKAHQSQSSAIQRIACHNCQ